MCAILELSESIGVVEYEQFVCGDTEYTIIHKVVIAGILDSKFIWYSPISIYISS